MKHRYEASVADQMWHYSENPRVPLSETEAFCGSILNKSGSQTRKQRDFSMKLREEMDRLMVWYVKLIRDPSVTEEEHEWAIVNIEESAKVMMRKRALEMCLACFLVGMVDKRRETRRKEATPPLQSFKVIAACCLLNELETLAREVKVEAKAVARAEHMQGLTQ